MVDFNSPNSSLLSPTKKMTSSVWDDASSGGSERLARPKTSPEVLFDSIEVAVEGVYDDELSAHRARRNWMKALEASFMLSRNQDVKLSVKASDDRSQFTVRCDFNSACARYAFWRLTHDQAPEVAELIETAHLPDFLKANNLLTSPAAEGVKFPLLTRLFRRLSERCGWVGRESGMRPF